MVLKDHEVMQMKNGIGMEQDLIHLKSLQKKDLIFVLLILDHMVVVLILHILLIIVLTDINIPSLRK